MGSMAGLRFNLAQVSTQNVCGMACSVYVNFIYMLPPIHCSSSVPPSTSSHLLFYLFRYYTRISYVACTYANSRLYLERHLAIIPTLTSFHYLRNATSQYALFHITRSSTFTQYRLIRTALVPQKTAVTFKIHCFKSTNQLKFQQEASAFPFSLCKERSY